MTDFDTMLQQAARASSNYDEFYNLTIHNRSESSLSILSVETVAQKEDLPMLENLVDLPLKSEAYVLQFLKNRISQKEFYTWAGQTLLAVHPFSESRKNEARSDDLLKPCVGSVVAKASFKLAKNVGKRNQAIVLTGESGSGKTYSACLALKCIANEEESSNVGQCRKLLWQAWSSVPLLTAFGNASTQHNNNSSRFGKLLKLQHDQGVIIGAYVQTYLLESSRITGPNGNEGNFHIFQQVLDSLNEEALEELCLSKTIPYKICPKVRNPMKNTYDETLKSLNILEITEVAEILTIIAAILNLGNVKFHLLCDLYAVRTDTMKFVENAAELLGTDSVTLSELLLKRTVNVNQGKRRLTIYKSPCLAKGECLERLNCLMRYLYKSLFAWIVRKVNRLIYNRGDFPFLGILDIYGFEIFAENTFEQLCINYANERLQYYFVNNHIIAQKQDFISEGFDVDTVDDGDYSTRVSLLDGPISVFSILNEESLIKRFNSDALINSKLTSTLRNHPNFVAETSAIGTEFSIKHFAGTVKYNSRSMVTKNRDKLPQEIPEFLMECNFSFLAELVRKKNSNVATTLLKKFKASFDSLLKLLDNCDVHYIKCIKPNHSQTPSVVDEAFFLNQLRINGIFEIINLDFQGYAIKLTISDFKDLCNLESLVYLKEVLRLKVHLGTKCIYLTESAYSAIDHLHKLKRSMAAAKIQSWWREFTSKWQNSFNDKLIHVSKKSSSFDISLRERDDVLSDLCTISPNKKVEEYVLKHNDMNTFEGDTISLVLEKILDETETKTFKRTAFFGERIVSFQKLAKIPVRIHLSRSCIPFQHFIPKSELPKGLHDIL